MIKSLHYSFGEKRTPLDPLEAEAPHVTFPLYRVMDWFVVTSPSEARSPSGAHYRPSGLQRRRDLRWKYQVLRGKT